ncbi:unnamed protein product, partial [Laminaria digitata]
TAPHCSRWRSYHTVSYALKYNHCLTGCKTRQGWAGGEDYHPRTVRSVYGTCFTPCWRQYRVRRMLTIKIMEYHESPADCPAALEAVPCRYKWLECRGANVSRRPP